MSLKLSGGLLSDSPVKPKQILSTVVPQSARLLAWSKEGMRFALSPGSQHCLAGPSLTFLCCHRPFCQLSSRIVSRTDSQSTGVLWDAPATSVLPSYCCETRSFILLIFSLLVPDLLFPPGFTTKDAQEPPLSGPGGIHSVFWSLLSFLLRVLWKQHGLCLPL